MDVCTSMQTQRNTTNTTKYGSCLTPARSCSTRNCLAIQWLLGLHLRKGPPQPIMAKSVFFRVFARAMKPCSLWLVDRHILKTKIYLSQFWNKSSQHMQASRQCYLPMLWIPNSKKEGVLCSSAVTGTCNPQSLVNFTIMLSKCLVHFATRVFRYTDTLCCHCNPLTSLFNLPITVLSSYCTAVNVRL